MISLRPFVRPLALPALALVVFTFPARALEEEHWRYRQPFALEAAGIVKVPIPLETLDRAQPDLRDVRLVAPNGSEIAFALVRPSHTQARWVSAAYQVSLTDTATAITLENARNHPWTAVELAVAAPLFMKSARIEGSNDGETWETWQEHVPVFRQNGAQQTVLPLPARSARWLRITLDDRRQEPVAITGVRAREAQDEDAGLETIALSASRTEHYKGQSDLTLELPAANLDLEALEIATSDKLFTRRVETAIRHYRDGESALETLASGTIFRVALEDAGLVEDTRFEVRRTVPSRELILRLHQGDSPPLAVTGVRGIRRVAYAVFQAGDAGRYHFWSGHPQAEAPRYDVAALAGHLRKLAPLSPAYEALVVNPRYHRPDPLAGLNLEGAALDRSAWSHHRRVELFESGVHLLELDLAALTTAATTLADVRLVHGDKQVPYLVERPGLERLLDVPLEPAPEAKKPRVSRWRIPLPQAGAPITGVVLHSDAPLFERHFRVLEQREARSGSTYETVLGEAVWRRVPGENASCTISLATPQTATLWLETQDGDNPAIPLTQAKAAHPVARLIFRADPKADMFLLTGNAQALTPRYDISLIAPTLLAEEKHPAKLAPAGATAPAAAAPLAFQAWIVWGALGAVVVILLAVVAKLLPKPPARPE